MAKHFQIILQRLIGDVSLPKAERLSSLVTADGQCIYTPLHTYVRDV